MDEDYIKKMSTRLHLLESIVKRQDRIIRRDKLAGLKNEEIYLEDFNEEWFSNKLYGNEIRWTDVNNDTSLNQSNIVEKRNIGMDRPTVRETNENKPGWSSLLCLTSNKNNCLYNFLWVVVNILCFIVSCYYIKTAYDHWQSSPVVQAMSNNQVELKNIPFPAMTICWENKLNEAYDFLENIDNCLDCDENICSLKKKLCNYTELATLYQAYSICNTYNTVKPLPIEIYKYMNKVMYGYEFNMLIAKLLPPCNFDWVLTKRLPGPLEIHTWCNGDIFQPFLSAHTNYLCMSYNSLHHKDIFEDHVVTPIPITTKPSLGTNPVWSVDNMMKFSGGLDTIPIYGQEKFFTYIFQDYNYDNICKNEDSSFASVIVHSPNEIPVDYEIYKVHNVRDLFLAGISFEPKITLARNDLVQYSPSQRGCYFTHEKKLAMFKVYSQNNCELECFLDAYLKNCGCIPKNYPQQNNSVNVCLVGCPRPEYQCDCLPDCNSLKYEITIDEIPAKLSLQYLNSSLISVINVKLKRGTHYINIRYSITSWTEFLAYTFGILGAYLGFSVTCVWKLLYFGFIRLFNFAKNSLHTMIGPLPHNACS